MFGSKIGLGRGGTVASVSALTVIAGLTVGTTLAVSGGGSITGGDGLSVVLNDPPTTPNASVLAAQSNVDGSEALFAYKHVTGGTATDYAAVDAYDDSTMDCTGAVKTTIAVAGTCVATRSAGANALTNIGGVFSASGAQVNYAIKADTGGDVSLCRAATDKLRFFAGTGTTRPTIAGTVITATCGTAMRSILDALDAFGLINDTSTDV